jgi:uncharacterized membrane protein YagU involved in acid resistance
MEFSLLGALVAGLVATLVMSPLMRMASAMGMTQMPPMPLVTGAMISGDRRTAVSAGIAIHYVMMGTVVFGLIYAVIFAAAGSASVLTGLLVGLVHAVVVGAMAMPVMPAMHPRMGHQPVTVGAGVGQPDTGEVQLSSPGFFGVRWGAMTPMGLVIGHLVYGLVVALVYQWIV